jgi:hypothetical protein
MLCACARAFKLRVSKMAEPEPTAAFYCATRAISTDILSPWANKVLHTPCGNRAGRAIKCVSGFRPLFVAQATWLRPE